MSSTKIDLIRRKVGARVTLMRSHKTFVSAYQTGAPLTCVRGCEGDTKCVPSNGEFALFAPTQIKYGVRCVRKEYMKT